MTARSVPHLIDRRAITLTALALLSWACTDGNPAPQSTERNGTEPALVIRMTDEMAFEPEEAVLHPGDVVEWVNEGRLPHTATARAGNAPIEQLPPGAQPWDSGPLQSGQRYRHKLDTAGDYRYVCTLHLANGMTARIRVVPKD